MEFENYLFYFFSKGRIKSIILMNNSKWGLGIGDWGLGIGDWGLGPIPNPQSPIPNPQSPIIDKNRYKLFLLRKNKINNF
jgi:hypothetical protein